MRLGHRGPQPVATRTRQWSWRVRAHAARPAPGAPRLLKGSRAAPRPAPPREPGVPDTLQYATSSAPHHSLGNLENISQEARLRGPRSTFWAAGVAGRRAAEPCAAGPGLIAFGEPAPGLRGARPHISIAHGCIPPCLPRLCPR
jgi:hypothetical protein